jgi:hypothetical protein
MKKSNVLHFVLLVNLVAKMHMKNFVLLQGHKHQSPEWRILIRKIQSGSGNLDNLDPDLNNFCPDLTQD